MIRQDRRSWTGRTHRSLLAASILVPGLLFAWAAWQDRLALLAEAARRVERTVNVVEQHANATLRSLDFVFARLGEHIQARPGESPQALHEYLAGVDRDLDEVESVFVTDGQGRVTAHSRSFPTPEVSVADRDYFRVVAPNRSAVMDAARPLLVGRNELAIGAPVTGRISGARMLNLARPRVGSDGVFDGLLVISVAQNRFELFQRRLDLQAGDFSSLVRADGTVLARTPAEQAAPELDRVRSSLLLGHSAGRTPTLVTGADGIERIVAYRKLADFPAYAGFGLDTAAANREWRTHLLIYGAVAALASCMLFAVIWLAWKRADEEGAARASLSDEMRRREAAETALRQAQKMEAVGQLTGGIAHDFNNLLAAVLGNLELLAKRLPDDPRLARYVAGATEGARRGAALTQRMLAFARRQELKPEAVDVPSLVRGMADLLGHSLGPTVQVETHFPVRLAPALADANQLETAILNLAVNSRDAMPRGGSLVIGAKEAIVALDSPNGLAPGHYVILNVTDTGEGMDEATLARAAEPFFTTKGVGKGTGLGLAMAHGLAAQSGGALRLSSTPGRGTTAELWLPAAAAADIPVPVEAPPLRIAPTPSRTVLVVDDDALVLAGTAAMLEDLGHRPVEAGSARQALEILRAGTTVDCVVTDQAMPHMTGTELAAELRRLHPRLPVILATGYAELVETEPALPRLAKPYAQASLAQAVSHATATPGDKVVRLRPRSDLAT